MLSPNELSTGTVRSESDLSSSSSGPTTIRNKGEMEIDFFGLFLVLLPPMLGGFLYGFDLGATSFVLVMLLNPPDVDDFGAAVWWTDLSSTRQGLVVSSLSLGALVGSHIVLMYQSGGVLSNFDNHDIMTKFFLYSWGFELKINSRY